MSKDNPDQAPDFEAALHQLETIVNKMEAGELNLAESLAHFEKGIQLTKNCQHALTQAEQRVATLMADDDDTQSPEL